MSAARPWDGVRLLQELQPEAAEHPLLAAVLEAGDRSSASDELASRVSDTASRRSFSRLRRNVLLPLALSQGHRVLDLGCGTGALTRALAEAGTTVTGLDGSLSAAQVAAARTRELPNCDIVCGDVTQYLDRGHRGEFDAVVVSGVLGNAMHGFADVAMAEDLVSGAREALKPDGILVVAVENQIGLQYLLGFPEDHRHVPWVGIDGFRSGRHTKAMTRPVLHQLLEQHGFAGQQWFFPYPDHWEPVVVAAEPLFGTSEGRRLLELFNRSPVNAHAPASMLVADGLTAFRLMLSAGVGPQTANSFLVVAGRTPEVAAALVGDGELWLAGSDRAGELMDVRVVRPAGENYTIALQDPPTATHLPPLVVSTDLEPDVLLGSNLEDEMAAVAASASAPRELEALLGEWWSAVQERSRHSDLQVDVMPRQFVRDGDGVPRFVNGRWRWQEPAPASWPLLRSMLLLVLERLWPAGAMAGLSWSLTPADAALALARLVDPHLTREDLDRAIALEAELQSRVRNRPAAEIALELRDVADRQLALLVPRPPLAQILERPLIAEAESKRRMAQAQMMELHSRDTVIGNAVELEAAQRQVKELAAKVAWLRSRQPAAGVQRARRVLGRARRMVLDL